MTRVRIEPAGLTVVTDDGIEAYFNAYWLRDNCPSSFDSQTRERIFDISAADRPPSVVNAAIGDGHLHLAWADGHESRFDLAHLMVWNEHAGRLDPARLSRRRWFAGAEPSFGRFEIAELADSPDRQRAWLEALLVDGLAVVTGLADSDAALTSLARLAGEIRPSVAGYYFHVRVHPDPVNLSYTAAELEMHTDTPAEEHAPGIQFLHCRANEVPGGRTRFVDGLAVAEDFRRDDPDGFDLLTSAEIPFFYDHDEFDWRSRQRAIEVDHRGRITGVTVSQHMADRFDLPQRILDRYYPAFCAFLRRLRADQYMNQLRLEAGECVVFDNHRIVHGREAFDAAEGHRYLRGCYVDRGELRSTYRTLVRTGRPRRLSETAGTA